MRAHSGTGTHACTSFFLDLGIGHGEGRRLGDLWGLGRPDRGKFWDSFLIPVLLSAS